MTEKLFGTDGVRGVANTELTPEMALALGVAAAKVLGTSHRPRFVIGRDTRVSGIMLEAALSAGLCSMGAEVVSLGVASTPAVACTTRSEGFDAGAVISASHNPFADNGIKFFGGDGFKLDDSIEAEIEAIVLNHKDVARASGMGVGSISLIPELADHYVAHIEEAMDGTRLEGVSVILDGSNGANYRLGPRVLRDLGAEVECIHCDPNGGNINAQCGSLYPGEMQRLTVSRNANIGLAFDGDADRVILSDEHGRLVDGDRVMMLVGKHLARQGKLRHNTVVGTVMSNMGLEVALRKDNVTLLRSQVGDRYVSEMMRKDGYSLGGEKSGHLIFGDITTTGDGLLTALEVLRVVKETGRPLSDLADEMTEYPQVLLGVRVRDRNTWAADKEIQEAIRKSEQVLAGRGRINVRASGTEKLIRIMAEGPDQEEIDAIASEIASIVERKMGAAKV